MESARAKHQLTASLPLQVMVYYNVILSVVYFAFAGVGVYIKVNGNYRSIEPYEYFLLPFAFCIWTLFEMFRLYFGFTGNGGEKVPQLSAFVLSTIFPQIPLLIYLGYGQRPETLRFSYEVPLVTILLLLNFFEIAVSYKALAKLISRQTASFFRLVQDQDDRNDDRRLLEAKEE